MGSLTPQKIDVRVVAATNKDLRQAIADSNFVRICISGCRWWKSMLRRYPSGWRIYRC